MERHGLYRSRTSRVFGGVAGGIAHSLNTDPAIVRLIFALLIIVGGGGILLYLILWIAIPEEPIQFYQESGAPGEAKPVDETVKPDSVNTPPVYPPRRNNGALIVGIVFILIGAIFLFDRFLPQFRFHFHDFWPIIIVIAGLALIISSFSGIKNHHQ
jgi:phage shock protein C